MRILVAWGSKHGGTSGISRVLAEEFERHSFGVTPRPARDVHDIAGFDAVTSGGPTRTPMLEGVFDQIAAGDAVLDRTKAESMYASHVPLGRIGEPDEPRLPRSDKAPPHSSRSAASAAL
jgi:menaquinone-dependent protoporphyrinogen IX oxidase